MTKQYQQPHGRNLRLGRFSEQGRIYLVTTVTEERNPVFKDLISARFVIQSMRYFHESASLTSLAYVLMPDHLHWLLVLDGEYSLSYVMRRFKGYTSLGINRLRQCSGRIWQSGYHDHALRREEDQLRLARYIVANPLRAGLVERIEDYPHWDAMWL